MKKFLIASALAVCCAFAAPGAAQATDVHVKLYLGVPHYSYRVAPDYIYRRGYGWYRPGRVVGNGGMSCARAGSLVRNRGYRNVAAVECRGTTYTFRATRNGNRQIIYVNSRTGGVWRG